MSNDVSCHDGDHGTDGKVQSDVSHLGVQPDNNDDEEVEGTQVERGAVIPDTQDVDLDGAVTLASMSSASSPPARTRKSARVQNKTKGASVGADTDSSALASDARAHKTSPPRTCSAPAKKSSVASKKNSSSHKAAQLKPSLTSNGISQRRLKAVERSNQRSTHKLATATSDVVVLQEKIRTLTEMQKNNEKAAINLVTARHNITILKKDIQQKQKEITSLKAQVTATGKVATTAKRKHLEAVEEIKLLKVKGQVKSYDKLQRDYSKLQKDYLELQGQVSSNPETSEGIQELQQKLSTVTEQLEEKTNELEDLEALYKSWDENEKKRQHAKYIADQRVEAEKVKAGGTKAAAMSRKREKKQEHRRKVKLDKQRDAAIRKRKTDEIEHKKKEKQDRVDKERAKIQQATGIGTGTGFFASNMGNQMAGMNYAGGMSMYGQSFPSHLTGDFLSHQPGLDVFQRMRQNQLNPHMQLYGQILYNSGMSNVLLPTSVSGMPTPSGVPPPSGVPGVPPHAGVSGAEVMACRVRLLLLGCRAWVTIAWPGFVRLGQMVESKAVAAVRIMIRTVTAFRVCAARLFWVPKLEIKTNSITC